MSPSLLPVIGQDLVAGLAEPGAMLLEATQNGRIAVVHHRPAMARHIPRTGIVPLLSRRRGSHHDKRSNEKNSDHLVTPYLSHARDQILPR